MTTTYQSPELSPVVKEVFHLGDALGDGVVLQELMRFVGDVVLDEFLEDMEENYRDDRGSL